MIDVPVALRPRVFRITEWVGWAIVLAMLCSQFGPLIGIATTTLFFLAFENHRDTPAAMVFWLFLLSVMCDALGFKVGLGVYLMFYLTFSPFLDAAYGASDPCAVSGAVDTSPRAETRATSLAATDSQTQATPSH